MTASSAFRQSKTKTNTFTQRMQSLIIKRELKTDNKKHGIRETCSAFWFIRNLATLVCVCVSLFLSVSDSRGHSLSFHIVEFLLPTSYIFICRCRMPHIWVCIAADEGSQTKRYHNNTFVHAHWNLRTNCLCVICVCVLLTMRISTNVCNVRSYVSACACVCLCVPACIAHRIYQ